MDAKLSEGFRAVPEEAPLAMPTQRLRHAVVRAGRPPSSPRAIGLRRLLVIGGAIALTGFGAREMYRVLGVNGPTVLAIFMLVLFVVLFAWIALSFTSSIAGFASMLAGGRRLCAAEGLPATRTALLMPTYNEDPARVMAGLRAIWESLVAHGAADRFDIFVLSDTTDADVWIEEEAAFLALRDATGALGSLFYRHRPQNTARKAGNIADWVTRWGGAYPQFLILDADSVMAGDTLVRLATMMEAHPDIGLLQTLPLITGGTTLFARLQQFAGRVYGPLIAHGIAWWHGAEGNYWGHNALIRTRAFAEQAGLPELKGRKPFGGHILSHDFVEAALMRRGGWAIVMLPGLAGSYEAGPPSLMDMAIRDRRWCQGNLQHAAVLPARGLHPISRLHLLTGIGSYITAPLWLLFLLSGILIALQARFELPNYFPAGKALFPTWPIIDPVRAMWVFGGTMGLLLAPKLLGVLLAVFHGRERRGCGGAVMLFASVVVETIIGGLIAPVAMLTQTLDVVAILLGRDSGWNAQRRDDGSIPISQTVRLYRWHTLLGLGLGLFAWLVSFALFLWMLPVVLGLALAMPLAAWTARRDVGQGFRRWGLLRIPEESDPPEVLRRASEPLAIAPAQTPRLQDDVAREGGAPPATGIARLLRDPALLDAHLRMLPQVRRPRADPSNLAVLTGEAKLAEAESAQAALAAMSPQERYALLGNPATLDRLVQMGGGRSAAA